ncbi:MAG: short-subunit dehydrogenase [Pontimonas sp.]|jgi:short-subunit dehydrogenase
MTVNGASILIVGATGGVGSELARALSSRGAKLTLGSRHQDRLSALGVSGASALGDITQSALDAYGQLDGVIYAAGAVAFGPIGEYSDEVMDALWRVNTRAWMSTLRAATPDLAASHGRGGSPFAVSLSGVVAESPTAGMAPYSAVKSALHAYGAAAGRELRRQGVRLIDARPGHTETELSKHPLAGTAPAFPAGLSPRAVANRIVEAIEGDEKDLPSSSFAGLS